MAGAQSNQDIFAITCQQLANNGDAIRCIPGLPATVLSRKPDGLFRLHYPFVLANWRILFANSAVNCLKYSQLQRIINLPFDVFQMPTLIVGILISAQSDNIPARHTTRTYIFEKEMRSQPVLQNLYFMEVTQKDWLHRTAACLFFTFLSRSPLLSGTLKRVMDWSSVPLASITEFSPAVSWQDPMQLSINPANEKHHWQPLFVGTPWQEL